MHRTTPERLRAATALAVLATAAACALVAPHFERPQITVVKIEVKDAQLLQQHFLVHVRVANPNDRALPVREISCSLQLGDEDFGHGLSAGAFTVPAQGTAEFALLVTTDLATGILKLLPRLRDSAKPLDYRLTGRVETGLAWLRTIPFDERGTLK